MKNRRSHGGSCYSADFWITMVEEEEEDQFNQLAVSKDSRRQTGPRHQRRQGNHVTQQPQLNSGAQLQPQSVSTRTVGSGESHTRTPDLQALLAETTRKKGRATLDDFKIFKGELRRSQGTTNEEGSAIEEKKKKKKKKKEEEEEQEEEEEKEEEKEEEEEEEETKNSRFDILAVVTKKSDEIQSEPVPLQPQGDEKLLKVDTSLKPSSNTVAKDDVLDTNDKKQQLDDQMALTPQPQRTTAEACPRREKTKNEVKPEEVAPTPDTPAVPKGKAKKVTFNLDDVLKTKDDNKQKQDDQIALTPQPQRTSAEACPRRGNTSDAVKLLQFIQPDSSAPRDAPSPTIIVPEELIQQLESLLQEEVTSNQHILDWIEANVEEPQRSSPTFLRALMTAVCKATVKADKPRCPVNTFILKRRMPVLQKYLNSDAGQQLQALYALQALSDTLSQPPRLLQMFFDFLYKWKLISSEAFYTWQTSRDPAEQQGKAVALKSVRPFLTFLSGFRGDKETRN